MGDYVQLHEVRPGNNPALQDIEAFQKKELYSYAEKNHFPGDIRYAPVPNAQMMSG
jgi:hypothetical protein